MTNRGWLFGALTAGLLVAAGPGCLTFVSSRRGTPLAEDAVAALDSGTPLTSVVAALGAPSEVYAHADGRVLIYRYRARNAFRLGLSAGQATRFIDATQVTGEALGNASFTLETIYADEDRLVVLLDRGDRVLAVGARFATAELPVW